jgi:hypothetical protein
MLPVATIECTNLAHINDMKVRNRWISLIYRNFLDQRDRLNSGQWSQQYKSLNGKNFRFRSEFCQHTVQPNSHSVTNREGPKATDFMCQSKFCWLQQYTKLVGKVLKGMIFSIDRNFNDLSNRITSYRSWNGVKGSKRIIWGVCLNSFNQTHKTKWSNWCESYRTKRLPCRCQFRTSQRESIN